jgi:hypoxanthine phosphoribosyltransferase
MPDHNLRVLLSSDQILERVHQMGQEIHASLPEGTVYLIGVLKGSWIFLADLARAMPRAVRIDFIGVSSYGASGSTSGEAKLTKDIDAPLEGTDVVIVEDIIDTGVTLRYLIEVIRQRRPRSVRVAALLDKPSRRLLPIQADYVGFTIPDKFVVGYGLDYAGNYRNLKDICTLDL